MADDNNNDDQILDTQTGQEDSTDTTQQNVDSPESLDEVDMGEESTGESQVEPLAEDGETPASPAETSGDSEDGTDSQESYDEGEAGAAETDETV